MNRRTFVTIASFSALLLLRNLMPHPGLAASSQPRAGWEGRTDIPEEIQGLFAKGAASVTAAFAYLPPSPAVNEIISFTDLSAGDPTEWCWNFDEEPPPDGSCDSECHSCDQNPTHAYQEPANYPVKLFACHVGANKTACDEVIRFVTVGLSLEVGKDGDGTGSVTSDPGGVNCGNDCIEVYLDGTTVELLAIPDLGSVFAGWSGDCDGSSRRIDVEMNENRVCVARFILDSGTVVIKKTTEPAGGTGFKFTDNIPGSSSHILDDGGTHILTGVEPGTYTVTEDDPAMNPGAFHLIDIECVDSKEGGRDSSADVATQTATIQLDGGETVTCTFTNGKSGSIVIEKESAPAGGRDFSFTSNIPGAENFNLDDGEAQSATDIVPGIYLVAEDDPATGSGDFVLANLECLDGSSDGQASSISIADRTATIHLDGGETVTCTFTNTRDIPPICSTVASHRHIAWWPFDELRGALTADLTGGHDGWQHGTPLPVTGKVDRASSFDGVDDYIQVPDDPPLSFGPPGGDFSITLWVKTGSASKSEMTLVDKRVQTAELGEMGYQLFLAEGRSGLRLNGTSFVSEAFVADGDWHFLALTVDRSKTNVGRWYLDGNPVGFEFDPIVQPGSLASAAPLRIGRRSFDGEPASVDPGGHFAGTLDELEIFNHVLTPDEVLAIHTADYLGQCKETIHVSSDTPVCRNEDFGESRVSICNHSTEARVYALTFTSLLATTCEVDIDGPTVFETVPPDSDIVRVAPRTCNTLPVRIFSPEDLAGGLEACYGVEVSRQAVETSFSRRASLWGQERWCASPVAGAPVLLRKGETTPVDFKIDNRGHAAASLDYRVEAAPVDPDVDNVVSLDGLPPGQEVGGAVSIAEGETTSISTGTGILELQPFSFYNARLLDSDSETALSSVGLRAGPPGLLLNDRRFRIEVEWRDFDDETGIGRAVPFRSDDSGLLWFFDAENWEMLVKVLDGCGFNDHFWVFAAAATNVEYTLRVTDTETGVAKEYFNPLGTVAPAITDVEALAVCSDESAALDSSSASDAIAFPEFSADVQRLTSFSTADKGLGCEPSESNLCLHGERFKVEVDWQDFENQVGTAQPVTFRSDDSGLLWFFDSENWEMLVKILDGCPINGHFWVFSAATTNVEYTLRVTDTETGGVQEYFNPLGNAAAAITDIEAFAACPANDLENP